MPEDQLNLSVSSIFVNRFDEATNLQSNGNHEEALEKYQAIFRDEDGGKSERVITAEFYATVEMRKAYCLMDLQKYQEAKAIFEELDDFFAGQLDMIGLYDFYFAYGNTLGNLGLLKEMEGKMARAMNIAAEYLEDGEKFRNVWYWVLYWEGFHQAWESLSKLSVSAYGFGVENNDLELQEMALKFRSIFAD